MIDVAKYNVAKYTTLGVPRARQRDRKRVQPARETPITHTAPTTLLANEQNTRSLPETDGPGQANMDHHVTYCTV